MSTKELIDHIIAAEKMEDILDVANFKGAYNTLVMEVHPDKCSEVGADEAIRRLNEWKEYFENGKEFKDDVSTIKSNGYWAEFSSIEKNLNWSAENYRLFSQLQGEPDRYFLKYLPKECELLKNGSYKFGFEKRAVPLVGLRLPVEHVNWILNRLLEYCTYLAEIEFVHCGINPESVFIVPETHGIQVVSFYHLTRIDNKVKTVSGKYKHWYPDELFKDKRGVSAIDIECCKRLACYLLGDVSGSGAGLRKTVNEELINFLLTRHENAYECLTIYRALLKKNFEKKFHILTI